VANQLYYKGRQALLTGSINWFGTASTSPAVVLCASEYALDIVAHDNLDDITAGNRVASAVLANTSASDGVADADDVVFSALTGSKVFDVVIFNWTGTDATSKLIAHIDTGGSLPYVCNGADLTLSWSSGACKIFML
jgi:hypothetical protein